MTQHKEYDFWIIFLPCITVHIWKLLPSYLFQCNFMSPEPMTFVLTWLLILCGSPLLYPLWLINTSVWPLLIVTSVMNVNLKSCSLDHVESADVNTTTFYSFSTPSWVRRGCNDPGVPQPPCRLPRAPLSVSRWLPSLLHLIQLFPLCWPSLQAGQQHVSVCYFFVQSGSDDFIFSRVQTKMPCLSWLLYVYVSLLYLMLL